MSLRTLFHVPYPLEFANPKGGGVRPVRMLRAFEELGEVTVVSGHAAERKAHIATVQREVRQGVRWDICYSESSTMPTALTEPHHLPTHPLLDFAFFARLRRARIPVGLFYRDIQWRFPIYGRGLNPLRKAAALAMYRYDLAAYARTVDVLFLPSLPMADHVPLPVRVPVVALPPGHEVDEPAQPPPSAPGLRLFYVGGLSDNYRLGAFLEAVHRVPEVHLTLCCRLEEWELARPRYAAVLGTNIEVVHEPAERLAPLFAQSHIGVLATEPQPYWTFAAPLKLYEYLGNGLPVIAAEGSLAGQFVAERGVGWTRPWTADSYEQLLRQLVAQPEVVEKVRRRVLEERPRHSWRARAEQAAQVLMEARAPRS